MKAIIIPLILFCNFCFGQKEFNDDSCIVRVDRELNSSSGILNWTGEDLKIDTIPCILLFIETSKRNTSRGCRWVHGYEVKASSLLGGSVNAFYLDYRKRRLPKNVIVFMSIN